MYTKKLILLSSIMEICNVLLKKSNTESTCKQTNATPQRKSYINPTLTKKRQ